MNNEIDTRACGGPCERAGAEPRATKHILYQASGNSRRFGENKLLYSYRGKPLYRHGLDMLHDFVHTHEDCTLTVVSRYAEIRQAAAELGIPYTDSPESEKGISYTIRAGLRSLGELPPEDFVVFVVADQPFLTAGTMERLLACAAAGTETAQVAYGDCPGSPAMFSARLIPELMELEGDTGGRKVIRRHACVTVQACSERELQDIDVKDDLEA